MTFVLLGSASPADLMKDRSRTPFNIGRRIELTDFSLGEARVLAGALHGDNKAREGLLKRSLYWTGGQPYLTQKLCLDMASDESCTSTEQVDELAKTWLGQGHARRTESNFAFISERSFIDPKIKSQALEIYEQLLSDNEIEDDPRSPAHATLRISGIVRTRSPTASCGWQTGYTKTSLTWNGSASLSEAIWIGLRPPRQKFTRAHSFPSEPM